MAKARKKLTMADVIRTANARKEALAADAIRQAMEILDTAASKSARLSARRRLINNRYLPADVRKRISELFEQAGVDIEKLLRKGIKQAWGIANDKGDQVTQIAGQPTGGKVANAPKATPGATKPIVNRPNARNYTQLDAFLERKDKGLNLSSRVYNLTKETQKGIESALVEGIKKGKSAKELAKDLKKFLRNPEALDKPGRGVYRNPQKNVERLARNEINLAFRTADYERWQGQWFVIGVEVKLSNAHKVFDICDTVKGRYPKDFKFVGWHVSCLCSATPILADEKTREAMMDYQLGAIKEPPTVSYINDVPSGLTQWTKANAKRVAGWKNQPYWIRDNPTYIQPMMGKLYPNAK